MTTHHAFIISDGSGITAIHSLESAIAQFENIEVVNHMRPNIRTKEEIIAVLDEAETKEHSFVVHTVVSKDLRHFILEQGGLHDIRTIDLMGHLLGRLTSQFEHNPTEKPGSSHDLDKDYFKRIEAIEYTLRHDDGQRVEGYVEADIILLGVSRTFKTPLSVYLAHKGWKVANYPIVLDVPIPEILFKIPSERIFCLNTFPKRLAELRQVRTEHLGGFTGDYSSIPYVQKELNYALRIYKTHPKWSIINVTHKPIEEISSEILAKLKKSK